jgi:DTW domain-containing protein YfiP
MPHARRPRNKRSTKNVSKKSKMGNKNFSSEGNNFINCETGYRQATQCVCATDQNKPFLHLPFVT